jgi:23S rRNA pseudouridine955/2504/2580 synthase
MRTSALSNTVQRRDVSKLSRYQQLTVAVGYQRGGAPDPGAGGGVEIVTVPASLAGQRIDNFLMTRLKGVPRSLVYKLLRRGEVRVNKGRVKPAHRLAAGDQVRLPPVRRADGEPPAAAPQGMIRDLSDAVLYEDRGLLVLDKPSGMAVHGGSGIRAGVIEALRAARPGSELELVHRLDRETSGCLLIAKRRSALRWLHEQLREGAVDKRYQALLAGALPRATTVVDLPLRKNQLRGGERIVRVDPDAGKPARTLFRRLARYGDYTLADVELDTGRTHQIRVHAASLGAPLAGDEKYGDEAANRAVRALGLRRLFLHACALTFRPRAEDAPIRVEAPLPPELERLLQRLRESHGESGKGPA